MNQLGAICYWAGRVAGFIHENLWRGWHQLFRNDYDAPLKWGARR